MRDHIKRTGFDGTLTLDGKIIKRSDWKARYPDFDPDEVCSDDNGDIVIPVHAMDSLQKARTECDFAFYINSAYRTARKNKAVGSKPTSTHRKGLAFDISIRGMTRDAIVKLHRIMTENGFVGVGWYPSPDDFIHFDKGRRRTWGDRNAVLDPKVTIAQEPVSKQKKKNARDTAGMIASTAPAVLSAVGGLALPTWLVSGAFILGLAFVGLILYRNYVK